MSFVVGTDGASPIYDPEGLWHMWSLSEIWLGKEASGKCVPKVHDYVINPETDQKWQVLSLDDVSLVPVLKPVKTAQTGVFDDTDVLIGIGQGSDSENYRAYLNDSVFPHTLVIDQFLTIKGSQASYAKIFLGSDTTSATGKVISKVYDNSGNFISDKVALELAALDSHTNYAIKSVKRCQVTQKLPDSERLTVVFYADDGHVVSSRQVFVCNTDTISDANQGVRYISGISLESIWLASTGVLEYPLNMTMDALDLVGVVQYSDGSTLKLPVNGGKFAMLGLEGRLASIEGQVQDLVLRYLLSSDEVAYSATGVNGKYITEPYKIKTVNANNSVSVKLFAYPVWQGAALGYSLRWFLLNMARNVFFEVTPYVWFSEATGAFEPMKYGYVQRKTVSINLRDVSGSFIPFNHTQVVEIVLNSAPTGDAVTNWEVSTEGGDVTPRYGQGVYGKLVNGRVSFAAGFTTQEDWLEAYYRRTRPLVNPSVEVKPLVPTHFVVQHGTTTTEWAIKDWDQALSIGPVVQANSTAILRFIRRTAGGDLQLAYAAAVIKAF